MNILVTGGCGYIGSHTVVDLIERKHNVIIIDNLVNCEVEVLDKIQEITNTKPTFYQVDACDFEAVDKIFTTHKIDSVIHFAALKAVGQSVKMPLEYYDNNLNSLINMLKVVNKHKTPSFIFSSSATVYGNEFPSPLLEEYENRKALNPYGYTKIFCEQILNDYALVNPNIAIGILRYFNPIGAHPSGIIGEVSKDIPNNLMPYISQVAVGTLPKLNVFGDDYETRDGTCIRDYIHVCDLAKGHVDLIDYLKNKSGIHTFNLGTGNGTSVLEIVHAFEKANNLTLPYTIVERRPGDSKECFADTHKANDILKWHAKYNIVDMCKHSYNFQKKHPHGYKK